VRYILRMQLDPLIERLGGPSRIAKICGIKSPSIYKWAKVPAERCVPLERATGIPRWELRPDDWGDIWPELIGLPGAPPWPVHA
jgi:DNA-binding transcriptional regulator YdaS (Cro superfamily)